MSCVAWRTVTTYRQRKIKQNLHLRARIVQNIREFFLNRDYLEVETPCRIPAPAPEANIDAQPAGSWYLHTSPELCMKQLLVAGFPKIFQICKCFRAGERGSKHLPELTMLEWYTAGCDYLETMDQCEALIKWVSRQLGVGDVLDYQGHKIDVKASWQRITLAAAFERFASTSMEEALRQKRFDELLAVEIEPELGRSRPVFVYDYPASCGALAKLKPEDRGLAERFELYIGGLELCNAFTELTDPVEQKLRFEWEQDLRRYAGRHVYPMPEKFLQSMRDMPEATGNALGIDRLVMLFADTDNIDDVVAFTPEEL